MPSMNINDIMAGTGVNVFTGGRNTTNYRPLDPQGDEAMAVRKAFHKAIDHMDLVAPKLAARLAVQEESMVRWAGVAKAIFAEERPIAYPGVTGTIGVDILSPFTYMYYDGSAVIGNGYNDYCSYADKAASTSGRTWDISLTADTKAYLAGGASNWYKASLTDQKKQFTVIAENGVLEFNTQPSINQMLVTTEAATQYSPIAMSPFSEFPVEKDTTIYQYQTLGQIPLWHNFGTKITVVPGRTGTSTIPLFGMTFFEQGLYSDVYSA